MISWYYDVIFSALRDEYNIFVAWLLSAPALPSRQVNMAYSWWMSFLPIERHHPKSRIFERMENILNDYYHPWTENPSNNSCSRQLTIVKAVVTLIASVVRSIDRSLFFSKLKLLILRQLWMKSAIKQRYRMNFIFVVFCLIFLLPNSMSKLIHNRCKFTVHVKLLIKVIRLQTNIWVAVRFMWQSVILCCSALKIY